MTHYFNTTGLTANQLAVAIESARRQEDAILALFRQRNRPMSPSMVQREMEKFGKVWPITSVRRAMTVLTGQGDLAQTEIKIVGVFGKPEHCWGLPSTQGGLFQ
ncbi:hypothetical protein V3390_09320 [Luteimonas sp. FXH3W]|uniref:Uncharacterized protein n=1 Tax=Aquilutibacter rugosus TaxID=3115820 RepID=A0ABU7V0X4_9GAMM